MGGWRGWVRRSLWSRLFNKGADVNRQQHEQEQAAPERQSGGAAPSQDSADAVESSNTDGYTPPAAPPALDESPPELPPGTCVGRYVVGLALAGTLVQPIYLIELSEPEAEEPMVEPGRLLLQLLPVGAAETPGAVEAVASSGLQHPRLLVPRERVPHEGRVYLVLAGLPASASAPRVAAGRERLPATTALRAAAGLADALGYLHRSGLAHGHVAPATLVLQDERAYLAGLERAGMLDEPGSDPQARIAEDTNALARTLGRLAGVAPSGREREAAAQDDVRSEPEKVLATIVARGVAGEFTSPDELAAAAGQGLLSAPHALPPAPPATAARLLLRHAVATTVGKVRSENQDAAAAVVFSVIDDAAGADVPTGIMLVADGMGGEAHGELASRIAARVVPAELLRLYVLPLAMHPALAITTPVLATPQSSPVALADALLEAVASANRQVREMAEYYRQDTGSTLTALAIAGARAILAHLGDSRAYLLRSGMMVQLSEDHTLLARLQAMDHPILSDNTMYVPRNFLYRSLGQEQAPPDLVELSLAPGDRMLICSDGLWDEVDDATIARELATGDDPGQIAERLVELANAAGGHDNSTALVLFIEAAPEPSAPGNGQTDQSTNVRADASVTEGER
jgi:serine/threonine protein phosphatase PrpC